MLRSIGRIVVWGSVLCLLVASGCDLLFPQPEPPPEPQPLPPLDMSRDVTLVLVNDIDVATRTDVVFELNTVVVRRASRYLAPDGPNTTTSLPPTDADTIRLTVIESIRFPVVRPGDQLGSAVLIRNVHFRPGQLIQLGMSDIISGRLPLINDPPVSNAGPDQIVDSGALVTLDGSASSDPEGDPLTYQWSQLSGTAVSLNDATIVQPRFTAPLVPAGQQAVLVFQLAVSDANNPAVTDDVTITVLGAGALAATATATPNRIPANGTLHLSASAVGGVAPYSFTWSAQPAAGQAAGTFTTPNQGDTDWKPPLDQFGTWSFQVQATDAIGNTASASTSASVEADCNTNGLIDADELAAGAAPDCNTNGTIDACDIAAGRSADCALDGIPDECQPPGDCNTNGTDDVCEPLIDCNTNGTQDFCETIVDCNTNGLHDACDIAAGEADCNSDGVPDECQPSLDCNSNSTSDACETLDDCNTNGVPDVCEFDAPPPFFEPRGGADSLLFPLDGTYTLAMGPNDDGSTGAIALGFDFEFYGGVFNTVFINNNGNLSFGSPFGTFTPTGFPVNGFPMVAPFWADVDTSGGDGAVWYKIENNTLIVTWDSVGYYSAHGDKLNTFQVAISDGTNPVIGLGLNVAFSYGDMQWTTGDASSGVNGFGGVPATVGANAGNGIDFFLFGRFDHAGTDYDGPGGVPDGVSFLDDQVFSFSVATGTTNINPIVVGMPSGNAVTVPAGSGQTFDLNLHFLSPEAGQTTSVVVNDVNGAGAAGLNIASTTGNVATVSLNWTPDCAVRGDYVLTFSATDDFNPPGVTTTSLTLTVACRAADCNTNFVPDECDLLAGVEDCDSNGVPDECDLAVGAAEDCNTNETIDACEGLADCNTNGKLDECDIAGLGGGNVLYGVQGGDCCGGRLYTIDPATAEVTLLVDLETVFPQLDLCGPSGVALSPDRSALFICLNFEDAILKHDLTTGQSSLVGHLTGGVSPSDIAFLPDGTMIVSDPSDRALYNVDPLTAVATFRGTTAVPDPSGTFSHPTRISGLTVARDGTLYGSTGGSSGSPFPAGGLYVINPQPNANDECELTPVGNGTGFDRVAGLAALPDGRLLGASARDLELFEIDPVSGVGTLIGTFFGDAAICSIDGMAFGGGSTDCNTNGVPDECDIAGGVPDCNGNALPDECDVADEDCNTNGFPDDCDLIDFGGDCNTNTVPDECDLATSAADCNTNGLPDECDAALGDCNTNGVPDECDLDSSAPGSQVVNGTFDSGVPGGTATGWTMSGVSGGGWDSSNGNPGGSFILNSNGTCVDDPTITQDLVGLIPGRSYRVQGDFQSFAPGFGNPLALSFVVAINGQFIVERDRPPGGAWAAFAADFVATAPSMTLAISAERGCDDSSYRVDNIAVFLLASSDCNTNGSPDECEIAPPFQLIGPLPYLCDTDSPFPLGAAGFFLETFEDGLLNTPGVSASAGAPTGPGGLSDSVDCDDGFIDGSGTNGRDFFFGSGSVGITFTFNPQALGGYPTHAGIVWTDGVGTITFEAFDAQGASLGSLSGTHADGSVTGTTAEDRFYGVVHAAGISAIRIRNASGGIEVDHLQYGIMGGLGDDCNTNGTLDECELVDCNTNGTLDECELVDCNTNGVPDDCDVAGGGFAGFVLFNDRAAFQQAVNGVDEPPLPDLGVIPGGVFASFSLGRLTFSLGPSATDLFVGGAGSPPDWSGLVPGNDIAISGPENLVIALSQPVFALGFDMEEPSHSAPNGQSNGCGSACIDSTFRATLKRAGVVVGQVDVQPDNDVTYFVGIAGGIAFDRVEFFELVGDVEDEFFGNFIVGPAGNSADCNTNGTPDECELIDCNTNGRLDACDLMAGDSDDCDANGSPDECDLAAGAIDCNTNGTPDDCETGTAYSYYFIDFESGADANWSTQQTDVTPAGGRRFLGRFENNTATLTLSGLPVHEQIVLEFDLFIINTWDGNQSGVGPDQWEVNEGISDTTLLHTTFSSYATQAFPDAFPGGNNPPRSGAVENDTLGYGTGAGGDAVYRLAFTFDHASPTLVLNFLGINLQPSPDETWGLDNVRISLVSSDCNTNGTLDECEPVDCNTNGSLDECELFDCNTNGVLDECDIASGSSDDFNSNGVPDECEVPLDCNSNGTPDDLDALFCGGNPACEDCNSNGTLDECDIGSGASEDLDLDGIPDECQTIFVNAAATGANDGSSWNDAFTSLQDAFASTLFQYPNATQIWVAAGTYRPDQGAGQIPGDQTEFFDLPSIHLYGGFAGGETSLSLRDPVQNPTILSGDLNGDDGPGFTNRGDNSEVVLYDDGLGSDVVVDGFIIRGGESPGTGGGLKTFGSVRFVRCVFIDNRSDAGAGAVVFGSPRFEDCRFERNAATLAGGGVYVSGGPLLFLNCDFVDCTGGSSGGGLENGCGSTTLINCRLLGNAAVFGGGVSNSCGNIRMYNCVFSGNLAFNGGGFNNADIDAVIVNCTFSNNTAAGDGGGIFVFDHQTFVGNSILWNNSDSSGMTEAAQITGDLADIAVVHSDVLGLSFFAGNGNIDADPLFADPTGTDGVAGTDDDDVRLLPGSPCIDAGDNGVVPPDDFDLDGDANTNESLPIDLDGNPRFQDDPNANDTGSGTPPIVDMGAYEAAGLFGFNAGRAEPPPGPRHAIDASGFAAIGSALWSVVRAAHEQSQSLAVALAVRQQASALDGVRTGAPASE